jgi:hypothetical protein
MQPLPPVGNPARCSGQVSRAEWPALDRWWITWPHSPLPQPEGTLGFQLVQRHVLEPFWRFLAPQTAASKRLKFF